MLYARCATDSRPPLPAGGLLVRDVIPTTRVGDQCQPGEWLSQNVVGLGRKSVLLIQHILSSNGLYLQRDPVDRDDVPVDFRFLALLHEAARDPYLSLGSFSHCHMRGSRDAPPASARTACKEAQVVSSKSS